MRTAHHLDAHRGYFPHPEVPVTLVRRDENPVSQVEAGTVLTCLDPCAFTASSGMIGLRPWMARPGEERQAYELVGECHVKGIMQGQLMNELREKGLEPQRFTLV